MKFYIMEDEYPKTAVKWYLDKRYNKMMPILTTSKHYNRMPCLYVGNLIGAKKRLREIATDKANDLRRDPIQFWPTHQRSKRKEILTTIDADNAFYRFTLYVETQKGAFPIKHDQDLNKIESIY